ncbi:DNA-binding protein, partial [Bacteroides caecigallinarum]|nr:DNA-binding protein [Bacteroides caecigallinarum]
METVSIEKKTFEALMAQWDAFVEKVTALQRKGDGKRLARWLTGDEVCNRLRISQR